MTDYAGRIATLERRLESLSTSVRSLESGSPGSPGSDTPYGQRIIELENDLASERATRAAQLKQLEEARKQWGMSVGWLRLIAQTCGMAQPGTTVSVEKGAIHLQRISESRCPTFAGTTPRTLQAGMTLQGLTTPNPPFFGETIRDDDEEVT